MRSARTFVRSFYKQDYLRVIWDREKQWVWHSPSKDRRPDLAAALAPRYNGREVVLLDSGRAGVRLAIRALGLEDAKIAVPAIICGSVVRAILAEGAKPVFIDIDEHFAIDIPSLREAIVKYGVRGVIAPHFGGIATNIKEVMHVCADHNVLVIEDAAQAFGLRIGDAEAGSFGDASVLSFGVGKALSSFEGGALVINKQQASKLDNEVLPAREPSIPYKAGFWSRFVRRRQMLPFMLVKDRLLPSRKDRFLEVRAMSKTDAAVLLEQLRKADMLLESMCAHAQQYSEKLPADIIAVPKEANTFLKFMIRCDPAKRAAAIELLRQRGIETECSFDTRWVKEYPRTSSIETSKRMASSTISLPTHALLSRHDIDRIATAVNDIRESHGL